MKSISLSDRFHVRIFAGKQFSRWAEDEAISVKTLIETAEEAFDGNIDADC